MTGLGRAAHQRVPVRVPAGMHLQVRTSRVLAVLAAAVLATGCGGGASPTAASSTPSPSPSYDRSTVRACEQAKTVVEGDGGEEGARAVQVALAAAELSDVPALRQIAVKYASDGTTAGNIMAHSGVIRVHTWCLDHGLVALG